MTYGEILHIEASGACQDAMEQACRSFVANLKSSESSAALVFRSLRDGASKVKFQRGPQRRFLRQRASIWSNGASGWLSGCVQE